MNTPSVHIPVQYPSSLILLQVWYLWAVAGCFGHQKDNEPPSLHVVLAIVDEVPVK